LQLGRYQVLKQLATGDVADVLLARATGLEGFTRHVVIKRIRPERLGEERLVDSFLAEARIAAALHHQNIVQVHDIGEQDGAYFFAMEYVHGEDVRRLIAKVRERGDQVPLDHVVAIITATAAGLHHAHEQRSPSGHPLDLVHRDVCPANILLGYDGSVKLVDFGMAQAALRATKTAAGTLKGKASYMSPEQCCGNPVDRRTDTFALGIVLYELATAQRLFKGDNERRRVNGRRPRRRASGRPHERRVAGHPRSRRRASDRVRARTERDRATTACGPPGPGDDARACGCGVVARGDARPRANACDGSDPPSAVFACQRRGADAQREAAAQVAARGRAAASARGRSVRPDARRAARVHGRGSDDQARRHRSARNARQPPRPACHPARALAPARRGAEHGHRRSRAGRGRDDHDLDGRRRAARSGARAAATSRTSTSARPRHPPAACSFRRTCSTS
jgi:tRNA A-37 threonylcarbamoyl transferase component Bud32